LTPAKPSIPSSITGTLPIEVSVKSSDFIFPKELPTLSLSLKVLNKESVEAISEKLGLGTSLDEFEDVNEGIKYFIDTDKYSFIATPKTAIIKYGMTASDFPIVPNKNLSDTELTRVATDFLVKNGFYGESQIKSLPVIYFKTDPSGEGFIQTSKTSAQLFQVGFLFSSSKYEIVTDYSEGQQIFVRILPDGTIYDSEILLAESVKEGITNYPLKNYDDLINNLSQAKLISLDGGFVSPSDLTIKDIQNLKIEKISLVYFLEKGKESLLQPIFVLEGPATLSKSSANYAKIYLPAYK
jgi:hypothetical protein